MTADHGWPSLPTHSDFPCYPHGPVFFRVGVSKGVWSLLSHLADDSYRFVRRVMSVGSEHRAGWIGVNAEGDGVLIVGMVWGCPSHEEVAAAVGFGWARLEPCEVDSRRLYGAPKDNTIRCPAEGPHEQVLITEQGRAALAGQQREMASVIRADHIAAAKEHRSRIMQRKPERTGAHKGAFCLYSILGDAFTQALAVFEEAMEEVSSEELPECNRALPADRKRALNGLVTAHRVITALRVDASVDWVRRLRRLRSERR